MSRVSGRRRGYRVGYHGPRPRHESRRAPQARLSRRHARAGSLRSGFAVGLRSSRSTARRSRHVDLDDPSHLHFEYVARMGAVIDQLRMPRQPLTAVHLGAGALTIPRYVERPGRARASR